MKYFNEIFRKNHTKTELCLRTIIKNGKTNTFDANAAYNDTCLHSTISSIQKRYNIHFHREYKQLPRLRTRTPIAHYWLEGDNLEKAKLIVRLLKLKRS